LRGIYTAHIAINGLGVMLCSAEQVCSKIVSDLTTAVFQATDMYSQVLQLYLMLFVVG